MEFGLAAIFFALVALWFVVNEGITVLYSIVAELREANRLKFFELHEDYLQGRIDKPKKIPSQTRARFR